MRRVVVESPFAPLTSLPAKSCPCNAPCVCLGCLADCSECLTMRKRRDELVRHSRYLDACLRDCLLRGETPFASHGLYTRPGVLDDGIPDERSLGILAGFAWRVVADATVIYLDLGLTNGMRAGEAHAQQVRAQRPSHEIEYRVLEDRSWRSP